MAAPYNPNTAAPQAYIAPPAPGPAFNPNQPAAAPAYVAPVQQPVGMPFGEFMQRLQVALQPGGTMTQTDLQAYQTAFGIADLQPLAVDPEKCLTFYKYLRDNGKIG
jgi:hypothetical protein